MNVKIKNYLFYLFLALLFIVINYFHIKYLETAGTLFQSGKEFLERDEYILTPQFTAAEDVVEQPFRPSKHFLKVIRIKLGAPWDQPEGEFVLQLDFKRGDRILCSEIVTLYGEDNWQYYNMLIDRYVIPGATYSLAVRQLEGPYAENSSDHFQLAYTPFHPAEHIPENQSFYYYNGETQEGEFEVCYIYEVPTGEQYAFWLGIDALFLFGIFLCLWLRKKLPHKAAVGIAAALWWLLPLLTYAISETILGYLWTITPLNHLLNLVLHYILYGIVMILLNNQRLSCWIFTLINALLTLTQYFVARFRGRPLFLHDIVAIKTAAAVTKEYHFTFRKTVFLGLLIMLFLLFLAHLLHGLYALKKKMRGVCLACIGGAALLLTCTSGKWMSQVNMWDISETYKTSGNLLTLFSQIPYSVTSQPEGYSIQAVHDIADPYLTEDPLKDATADAEEAPIPQTIILIMNESFSDLEILGEIRTDSDLLPYWDALEENCIKGYTYVPVFGAGTANSEYEALTGNAMNFLPQGSTAYQMNVKDQELGLVSLLEAQGYQSTALHPYDAANWNRPNVYRQMGFDEFYADHNWYPWWEFLRWCASDTSAYNKVIEQDQASDEKQFLFLVTMQNHGGYAEQWDNFSNEVFLDYETNYPQAEQYLSLMQESDRAFHDLLEYYKTVEENTMIILFGDHQAAIEDAFYEELYEKPLYALTFEEYQSRYKTPFVIWTNYDTEEQQNVEISTNYLGSLILKQAGLELSPYNRFQLDLMETIPVIGVGGIRSSEGSWYEMNALPEEYAGLIRDYQILQYNNVFDRKNRVERVFSIR